MNSTFVRLGKNGWDSISRPISCHSNRAGKRSMKTSQWGLPMETTVTG